LSKRGRGQKEFQLNLNDYKSFDHAPYSPERSESDSMISIKEEESCDTKKQSESESTTSEATKKRFEEEE